MYNEIKGANNHVIRVWNSDVPMESGVFDQAREITAIPGIVGVRLMPDAHVGSGSCVGTVIASRGVIIPATVSVDIGCGMVACRTSLTAGDLPDSLSRLRSEIELMVPVGFDDHNSSRLNHRNHANTTKLLNNQFSQLEPRLEVIMKNHPGIKNR